MDFKKIRSPLKKIGQDKYVIGDNQFNPLFELSAESANVPANLEISGINFIDYITGDVKIRNFVFYDLNEAFEETEQGDITPTNAEGVIDTHWVLTSAEDLTLRHNHFRFNTGPEAFTDEISF
jgi:hypothetical protein